MDTLRYFRFIFLHNSPKTNLSEILLHWKFRVTGNEMKLNLNKQV